MGFMTSSSLWPTSPFRLHYLNLKSLRDLRGLHDQGKKPKSFHLSNNLNVILKKADSVIFKVPDLDRTFPQFFPLPTQFQYSPILTSNHKGLTCIIFIIFQLLGNSHIWHCYTPLYTVTDVCVCSKSLQTCPTLSHAMDCSLPGSFVHGIFQARILEWSSHALLQGIFLSQRSNPLLLHLLHWQADSLPQAPGKPTPTQGRNPGSPHCRQILQLSHKGIPYCNKFTLRLCPG